MHTAGFRGNDLPTHSAASKTGLSALNKGFPYDLLFVALLLIKGFLVVGAGTRQFPPRTSQLCGANLGIIVRQEYWHYASFPAATYVHVC